MTAFDPVVLHIRHTQADDGRWLAVCDQWRGWRYRSDELDRDGAARSLKSHRSRHVRVEHDAPWDGKP